MKKCPYCYEEIQEAAIKCKHCGEMLGEDRGSGPLGSKRLYRSGSDQVFSGVCAGLADYLGMDVTIVRLLVALLIVFSAGLPGVIVYVILACVLPVKE